MTKQSGAGWVLAGWLATLLPVSAAAERRRVRVDGGTVVSDRGSLVRGTTIGIGGTQESAAESEKRRAAYTRDAAYLKSLATHYGLNAVRVTCYTIADKPFNPDWYAIQMDYFVDLFASAGMYVIIEYHELDDYSNSTRYSMSRTKGFWDEVAPRYKDRTHVLYEIQNEPAAWFPRNYSDRHAADQVELYTFIRARAPETHILVWDFANSEDKPEPVLELLSRGEGVDYRNASVAFHWYRGSKSAIEAVKRAGYPLICTEAGNGVDMLVSRAEFLESIGVSWIPWSPYGDQKGPMDQFRSAITEAEVRWIPDYATRPGAGQTSLRNSREGNAVGRPPHTTSLRANALPGGARCPHLRGGGKSYNLMGRLCPRLR